MIGRQHDWPAKRVGVDLKRLEIRHGREIWERAVQLVAGPVGDSEPRQTRERARQRADEVVVVETQIGERSAQAQLARHSALERAASPVPEQQPPKNSQLANRRRQCVGRRRVCDDAKQVDYKQARSVAREHACFTRWPARALGQPAADAVVEVEVLVARNRLGGD